MKKQVGMLVLLIALLGTACSTPDLVLSSDLKNECTTYEVKGKQGLLINQVISWGPYHTSKVKRGWTSYLDIPFTVHFQKAKQKFEYVQYLPDGRQCNVMAMSTYKNAELSLLRDFFSLSLDYENTFAGVIVPKRAEEEYWDFIIHNPGGEDIKNLAGHAISESRESIKIKGVRKIEGHPGIPQLENFGFEFSYEGKTIAAVSVINNGRVYLGNDIPDHVKPVTASLISAFLLRQDISEN